MTNPTFDLIFALRGGAPSECDFCGQPYTEDRWPEPEEAGQWACSECVEQWKAQDEIARLTVERDAALAQVSAWQPIATAPRDETLFLATGLDGGSGPDRHVAIVFCDGAGFFDDFDEYTYLTHWMPLPAPPVDSSAAQATAVDDSTGADPVGKEG